MVSKSYADKAHANSRRFKYEKLVIEGKYLDALKAVREEGIVIKDLISHPLLNYAVSELLDISKNSQNGKIIYLLKKYLPNEYLKELSRFYPELKINNFETRR